MNTLTNNYMDKDVSIPTVDDMLLGMTTIIECRINAFSSQGSGFFFNLLEPNKEQGEEKGHWRKIEGIWLITNRHVALPKINDSEVYPNTFTFNIREIVNDNIEWLPITLTQKELSQRIKLHQDNSVDVVAIKVDDLIIDIISKGPQRKIIAPSFLTNDNLPQNSPLQIEVTSDIIVASYPRGFYDHVNKFPIIKSGIIASSWGVHFNGQPTFLIDAQLFPGSSGGLVISKPTNIAIINGNLATNSIKQYVLLGVYSGEPITVSSPIQLDDLTITKRSSYGLGTVWYSSIITDIIK